MPIIPNNSDILNGGINGGGKGTGTSTSHKSIKIIIVNKDGNEIVSILKHENESIGVIRGIALCRNELILNKASNTELVNTPITIKKYDISGVCTSEFFKELHDDYTKGLLNMYCNHIYNTPTAISVMMNNIGNKGYQTTYAMYNELVNNLTSQTATQYLMANKEKYTTN